MGYRVKQSELAQKTSRQLETHLDIGKVGVT